MTKTTPDTWSIPANLRWLAEQSDRPGRVPCGELTGKFLNETADRFEALTTNPAAPADGLREKVVKVRDGYASQAKFADPEPAAYFREFVRRIDTAIRGAD